MIQTNFLFPVFPTLCMIICLSVFQHICLFLSLSLSLLICQLLCSVFPCLYVTEGYKQVFAKFDKYLVHEALNWFCAKSDFVFLARKLTQNIKTTYE